MVERILVIDDSQDSRILMAIMLKMAGYEVQEAADGFVGLKYVDTVPPPDLILLDVMMPGMDGYEVCRTLKADPRTRDIPVIFLSALGQSRDKIRGLEAGGADYITKPFDRGEVLARVRTHLKLSGLNREIMAANRELQEKQQRLEEDLRAAAGIQQSLLPRRPPMSTALEIAWRYLPSEAIGGDIFNIIPLGESLMAFYMMDVSGHGVPAAMVTVSVYQFLYPRTPHTSEVPGTLSMPQEVMAVLDREYPFERFDKYFTMFYGVFDLEGGFLTYSSAGHPPPLMLREGRPCELLTKGGPIIGLGGMLPFEEETVPIAPGDRLIVYTDGMSDLRNLRGELYGEKRFYRLLETLKSGQIEVMMEGIADEIDTFLEGSKPPDDITLLGIVYRGGANED